MRAHHQLFKTLITLMLMLTLGACSSGPEEIPLLDSISSPAKLLDQGIYHYNNNNYPKAIHDFEKSLLQYRSIDNQAGIANSCLNLAKSYMAINNNRTAADYLNRADAVIERAELTQLKEHLQLLKSSLAINNKHYDQARQELETVLTSKNTSIKLAALKNRTGIAFLNNNSDKAQWLQQYKTLQNKTPENTLSHRARILRFEAELADDENRKTALLSQSLSLSQQLANRTAIAATLTQWASVDFENKRYLEAEDKNLRALFIRHQLSDVKNTLAILKQLQNIYSANGDKKETLAENWITKLSNNQLENWDLLFSDFETYPKAR